MVYLALGDSYTIGEGLHLAESFPWQLVQLLRRSGRQFSAPEIIARTGWTTDELMAAMDKTKLLPAYDLITLLIGVNNQYRNYDLEEYGVQFEQLLLRARQLRKPTGQVIVLSIPDWGVSPFAATHSKSRDTIATEINSFNALAQQITQEQNVPFLDITRQTRKRSTPAAFTADGLHPNAEQHAGWARQVAAYLHNTQ